MTLRTLLAVSTVFAGVTAPTAIAQGFYVDGGYANVSVDYEFEEDDFEESFDFDFGAIGGHVGYDFNSYIGVEAEVLVGIADESISVSVEGEVEAPDVDVDIDVKLKSVYGVFAKGNLPVSEQFSLFARLGYVTGELEASTDVEGVESFTDSDEAIAYGVGATFAFSENFYARGDYKRYDFEGTAADALMIGAGVRF
jgi:outer membrane immunogenic protein